MSKIQLVKYKSGKHQFEVATKQGSVLKYREGGQVDFSNVCEAEVVRSR